MKRKLLRALKWLGGLFLGLSLVYTILMVLTGREVKRELKALEAAQRPLTMQEIIPAEVEDSENAGLLYATAVPLIDTARAGTQTVDSVIRDVAGNMLDGRATDEQKALAAQAVAAIDETALALIRHASERPHCRFDIDYAAGPAMDLQHITTMRSLSRAMAVSALVKAAQGSPDAAWQDALAAVRLAGALREEPLLISQLVRIAQINIATTAIERLTEAHVPPADIRAALDSLLTAMEDAKPLTLAIDGERILFGDWVFRSMWGSPVNELPSNFRLPALCGPGPFVGPWMRHNHAHYLRVLRTYSEWMEQPFHEVAFGRSEALTESIPKSCVLARLIVPAIDGFYYRAGESIAQMRLARIGMALAVHRDKYGKYPETLQDMDDDMLAPLPRDPFTDADMVYRPQTNGFLLYSLGGNRMDDQGQTRIEASLTKDRTAWDVTWSVTNYAGK